MAYTKQKKGFWANLVEIAGLLLLVFLIRTFGFGLYQVPTGSMETTMLVGDRFFADKLSYVFRDPVQLEVVAFNEPPAFFNYSKNPFINFYQNYLGLLWGPSNWTKRVIGLPGDVIEGKIEDDKPVVYRNGVKLDEPYLNKLPLIYVWKEDPKEIIAELDRKFRPLRGKLTAEMIEKSIQQELNQYISQKTYDPGRPFDNQPYYDINPSRVERDQDGSIHLRWPTSSDRSKYDATMRTEGKNYWDGSDEFYVKLGADEYWMMGDNRKVSKDSRYFGPVQRSFIHGRILFRIWSIDSDENWWIWDLMKHPVDFWKRLRWSRFFQIIW